MLRPKPGGQVVRPSNRPIQFERGEATTAEVNKDALAIRDGRRIAARTELALFGRTFLSEPREPQLMAMNVQRQDGIPALVGGGQVDVILPEDRGGAAFPGQGELPGHTLGIPGSRVVPGRCAVITRRPAPT